MFNRNSSTLARTGIPSSPSSKDDSKARPPVCAMASKIKTPGIMGSLGKWPKKYGSSMLTFLRAIAFFPFSISTIRSINRKGKA